MRSAFFVCPDGLKRHSYDLIVDSHKAFGILEFLTVFLRKVRREGLELLCIERCVSNEKLPADNVQHLTGRLHHIALFNFPSVLAKHITVQSKARVSSVKARPEDGIATHSSLKRLVVGADAIGS